MSRGLDPQFCPSVSILLGPQFYPRVSLLLVLSSVHVSVLYRSSVLSTCQSFTGSSVYPRVSLLLVLSSVHVSVLYWSSVLSTCQSFTGSSVLSTCQSSAHIRCFPSVSIIHSDWPATKHSQQGLDWPTHDVCLFSP